MAMFGFGAVGTGFIAGVIADALGKSRNARLVAVSSRKLETAKDFVVLRQGVAAVQGWEALLNFEGVDAVYVATPTSAKEEIVLAAIAAGKHVLVEKPFLDRHSAARMIRAAEAKGVLFMDATHFVHHPRTAIAAAKLARPQTLHTAMYIPHTDKDNIRFDLDLEPTGAIGNLAWYSMRAVVEYLRPKGRITKVKTVAGRDSGTGAVIRGTGVVGFESGEVSTFDAGFTAGTVVQDLQLLGTDGVIAMDDFMLDSTNSALFQNADVKTGYWYRTGVASRKDTVFVETPGATPAHVAMMENFAELARSGDAGRMAACAAASLKTQELVDAIWDSVEERV